MPHRPPTPEPVRNRVALVTGGASGIGRATVLRLAASGVRLMIVDQQRDASLRVADEAQRCFPGDSIAPADSIANAHHYPVAVSCLADVSQEHDVESAVRRTLRTFGRLDILVNSAGLGGALGRLTEIRVEDWDRTIAILLRGVFLTIKHASRAMIDGGRGGAIVNLSSVTALAGGGAGAAYSAAKAGVLNLSKSAAVQLAAHHIRVNAVLPGTIITPLLYRGGTPDDVIPAALATQPWPEPGQPEDVAEIIAFLASDAARFMTGAEILADGGAFAAAGANLHQGNNPLGQAIVRQMTAAGITSFDHGSAPPNQPTTASPDGSRFASERPSSTDRDGDSTSGAQKDTTPVSLNGQIGPNIPRRSVLITGVSRGLGRALAERLIDLGHTVIGCARSSSVVEELRSRFGMPHRFAVVDVARDQDVDVWIRDLVRDGVVPDFVINNAAATHVPRPLWRFDAAEVEQVLQVNVIGPVNVIRHVLPPMLVRKTGMIVNISSGWGREAAARTGPYCASKFAIEGLTKSLALELPPGVGAVTLHPGIVRTEALEKAFGQAAELYPTPAQWAVVAAAYLLELTAESNGHALSVPGMATFRGLGAIAPA